MKKKKKMLKKEKILGKLSPLVGPITS